MTGRTLFAVMAVRRKCTPLPQDIDKSSCKTLQSKPTQIQAASQPGDSNSGPHVQLFALCEDGSIWVQYHSSGFSNVQVAFVVSETQAARAPIMGGLLFMLGNSKSAMV